VSIGALTSHSTLEHSADLVEACPLLAHVAWSGGDRRVSDVWVAGEPVVADGVVLHVDEERARAGVQQRAERLAAG
jgi:5-methylthioadenosine/S-adenosylhomocysteine deaminase